MSARPYIFVDSNVLIEALFEPRHPAGATISLALAKQVRLVTCNQVIEDVELEIIDRCEETGDLGLIDTWHEFIQSLKIKIEPDATETEANNTYRQYIGVMRHKADIPILAVAIRLRLSVILSGNREHFNDAVSERCGIKILSCKEFFSQLIRQELNLTV